VVATASGRNYVRLWTDAAFKSAFGRAYDGAKDYVGVMNAAGSDNAALPYCAQHWYGDGVYVYFDRSFTGPVRVNYLVALAP
jgi:hypothetical protein